MMTYYAFFAQLVDFPTVLIDTVNKIRDNRQDCRYGNLNQDIENIHGTHSTRRKPIVVARGESGKAPYTAIES